MVLGVWGFFYYSGVLFWCRHFSLFLSALFITVAASQFHHHHHHALPPSRSTALHFPGCPWVGGAWMQQHVCTGGRWEVVFPLNSVCLCLLQVTSDNYKTVNSSVNGSGFRPFDMVIPFSFRKGEITGKAQIDALGALSDSEGLHVEKCAKYSSVSVFVMPWGKTDLYKVIYQHKPRYKELNGRFIEMALMWCHKQEQLRKPAYQLCK